MTKTPPSDDKALNVLQAVYSHQLERQDFGDLLQTLDEAILGLTSAEFEDDTIPTRLSTLENLEEHFQLATKLDLKLSEDDEEREIIQLCEGKTSCFAVDHTGNIFAASPACEDRIGKVIGRSIDRLPLRNTDIKALRNSVQEMTAHEVIRQKDRALFARHTEDEQVTIFHLKHFRKSKVVLAQFDHLVWTQFVDDAVHRNFAFTNAESNVVRLLVEGKRPVQIAESLNRSIETVRSHIKSAQSKSHVRDAAGLIRLMCEIMTISDRIVVGDPNATGTETELPQTVQINAGGAMFDVTQMVGITNPDPARTALFVHGLLQGPFLTRELRELLGTQKIEMLSPSRPGYGGSTGAASKDQFAQRCMEHMQHLLDAQKTEKTVLVAHMLGMQLAARFAQFAPDRISAIVGISGVIPIMSKAQLKKQSRMQRMAMLAAKYSPATLGYISQIGERYLRDGNEIKCLKQLFATSQPDQRALQDPEITQLLKKGFQHLIASGKSAFMNDTQAGIDDWEADFRVIGCPVVMLHGAADIAVPAQTVRDIIPQFPNWRFEFFEDAGQTLLHTHPKQVADHLAAIIDQNAALGVARHSPEPSAGPRNLTKADL